MKGKFIKKLLNENQEETISIQFKIEITKEQAQNLKELLEFLNAKKEKKISMKKLVQEALLDSGIFNGVDKQVGVQND